MRIQNRRFTQYIYEAIQLRPREGTSGEASQESINEVLLEANNVYSMEPAKGTTKFILNSAPYVVYMETWDWALIEPHSGRLAAKMTDDYLNLFYRIVKEEN